MEKYSSNCKFILVSDQISKIIEPIRSRCVIKKMYQPTWQELEDYLVKTFAGLKVNEIKELMSR